MSGGRLVVVDRCGRDVKRFSLGGGLATLGSGPACDIRVMLPHVDKHHATVAVHAAQTVVRNVGSGLTLVNGRAVSVAALKHGDIITLGDRCLRWEYYQPTGRRLQGAGTCTSRGSLGGAGVAALAAEASAGAGAGAGASGRARRRTAGGAAAARDQAARLRLEMTHRASMPGAAGGKQVAIVQPQRRDPTEQIEKSPGIEVQTSSRRSKGEAEAGAAWGAARRRRSLAPPRAAPPPLRMALLRKVQSAHKPNIIKIEAPLKIDHTKQAAIMLMTGHTPKSKLSLNKSGRMAKKSPSLVVKKSPLVVKKSPSLARRSGSRRTTATPRRNTRADVSDRTVTILDISDETRCSSARGSSVSTRSSGAARASPRLPSPKKSALKDMSRKSARKTESIKFDLSNLEVIEKDDSVASKEDSAAEMTLRYSESSVASSPRSPRHSRSARLLASLGEDIPARPAAPRSPASPASPRARLSLRGSAMVQKALNTSDQYSEADRSNPNASTTLASAFRTRTLSPRTRDMESYSVVDLVSLESNDLSSSVHTAADGAARRTRSSLGAAPALGSSTPYGPRAAPAAPRSASRVEPSARRSPIDESDLESPEQASPRSSRRAPRAAAGSLTPEARPSAADAGTPVLNIQGLLDSSRGKARRTTGRKRKTIGVLSEPKRRGAARAKSWGSARDVTPRSRGPLAHEAVKNKHSTAKKPQSKRSIIDDLDRSDIVKQLFNSPVKRKLSQSMSEFSRREREEERREREERTLGALRQLFRRSPRDDLSDVRGVRRVFGRAPADRLSDVAVKRVFAREPADELRRVSAVRRLWAAAPRDDLRDVSGVRRLFEEPAPGRPAPGAARAALSRSLAPRAANTPLALPLKKRSLPARADFTAAPLSPRGLRLPLKKRAVVHSTPLKGARRTRPPAQVSPIAAPTTLRSRVESVDEIVSDVVSAVAVVATSTPAEKRGASKRATRNRKGTEPSEQTVHDKHDASKSVSKTSPKKARATRAKKEEVADATPKKTRARARRATVVVVKPSPQMVPRQSIESKPTERPKRGRRTHDADHEVPSLGRPKRGRGANKGTIESVKSPKEIQKATRNRTSKSRAELKTKGNKKVEMKVQDSKPKRNLKTKAVEESTTKKRGRKGADEPKIEPEVKETKPRGAKVKVVEEIEPKRTRRGNKENQTTELEPTTRRGKNKQASSETEQDKRPETKTRGKKIESQSSVQSEPTRTRRAAAQNNTVIPETKATKRKATAKDNAPNKLAKTEKDDTKTIAKKQIEKDEYTKTNMQSETVHSGRGRRNKTETEEQQTRPNRARRGAETKENVSEDNRKRKTNNTSTKDIGTTQAAKKTRAAASPAEIKTRSTRAKPQPQETAVGRSRRR